MSVEVKEVGVNDLHGIYAYRKEKDVWVMLESSDLDPFIPKEKYAVIYFDNTRCPACRRYDIYWYPFVRKYSKLLNNHGFYIVVCGWFARECESPAASATFTFFDVHASPTTFLVMVEDRKVLYKEKYEGVLTDTDLEKVVPGFSERAEKALRGEPVKPPLTKEDTLLNLLKKILREGAKK